ncbi:hypothetical protein PWT90_05105 [Aphanocladium album]|nr:hypothetical protein PWT90_05105 [Aphanocladium album]
MFETGIARDDEILHSTGLQGFPSAPSPGYTTAAPPPPPPTHTPTMVATTTPTFQPHHAQYHSDGGIDRLAVLADASISDHCGGSGPASATTPSESTVAAQSPPSAGPSTMPGTPVHSQYYSHHHHHKHVTPQAQTGSGSPLVMSCNTAAQIIAEMQGGAPVNKHAVKASLGCEDSECECFVKNTLLFQIMEKNAA